DALDAATAAKDRGDVAVAAAAVERVDHELGYAAIGFEVPVDERGGFFVRNAEAFRESKGALAINDAEVDRLGAGTLGGSDFRKRDAEDLAGDERVDVVVAFEGSAHGGVVGVVRKDTELDLRIIGAEQLPARQAGDERGADFAAFLGADRDVLQVGV